MNVVQLWRLKQAWWPILGIAAVGMLQSSWYYLAPWPWVERPPLVKVLCIRRCCQYQATLDEQMVTTACHWSAPLWASASFLQT